MSTASNRKLERVLAGKVDGVPNIVGVGATDDDRRAALGVGVPEEYAAGGVITGVCWKDRGAFESGA